MRSRRAARALLLCLFAAACATASGPTDEELLAEGAPAAVVDRAARLGAEGETERALALLDAVARRRPNEEIAPRAAYEAARIQYEAGAYDRAAARLGDLLARYPSAEVARAARLLLARTETAAGRPERAVSLLKDLVKSGSDDEKGDAQRALAEAYEAEGKPQAALWWHHRSVRSYADPAKRRAALASARAILESRLTEAQLEEAAYLYRGEEVGELAAARLRAPAAEAEAEAAKAASGEAAEGGGEFLTLPPGAAEGRAGRVGVVLPLSGPQAGYGERVLRALLLGARAFEPADEGTVELVVKDSGGRPDQARAAVDALANEDGVMAIVGPVLGPESRAAAERAQALRVPLVALTPEPDVTAPGEYVFRNYFLPAHQAEAVAEKAVRGRGLRRFAIFNPRDPYGRSFAEAFWWAADALGGAVVTQVEYDPAQTDFGKEIAALMGPYFEGSRASKFDKNGLGDFRVFLDFDAVYIPEDSARIGMITSQFAYNELRGVLLLGNNGWNDDKLFSAGAETVRPCLFVDSFFAEDPRPQSRRFLEEYRARYGAEPKGIDAEAYDTVGLLAAAMRGSEEGRAGVRAALASLQGYLGASGTISFDDRREARRDPRLLKTASGKIVDAESFVEPAGGPVSEDAAPAPAPTYER